jgi:hypothetical protein
MPLSLAAARLFLDRYATGVRGAAPCADASSRAWSRGIVNLKKSLDEFSPLSLQMGLSESILLNKFWVDSPLSY